MTALIEGSSRFVIDKLLEKLAALERRMDVPPG
jgi:hypothetical protein